MAQNLVVVDRDELTSLVAEAVRSAAGDRTDAPNENALTTAQVCKRYGIAKSTLWKLRQAGLPCFHVCDSPRFIGAKVQAWLEEHGGLS
jgi:hypothetical protein